jgi:pantoate--beta-alanine ligase
MKTVRDVKALRQIVDGWRQDRETVAFVPTLGNLHRGHMSLIALAHERAERVVVSIFVNPTQFGPGEDFQDYPRTLAMDRRRLSRAEVDLLFLPTDEEIYASGEPNETQVSVPGLSELLCGASRPGHFDGVTSVVNRLLNIVQPNFALFGQKDYQQLVIIRRMVADLHMPVEILAGPTFRDANGLAMSSRNQYLTDEQKTRAPGLFKALKTAGQQLQAGNRDFAGIESSALESLRHAGFDPDYVSVRKAGDLSPADKGSRFLVVMAAARLGKTRLIDNVLIEVP